MTPPLQTPTAVTSGLLRGQHLQQLLPQILEPGQRAQHDRQQPLGRLRPSPAGGGLADELALPRDAPVRVGDVSVGLRELRGLARRHPPPPFCCLVACLGPKIARRTAAAGGKWATPRCKNHPRMIFGEAVRGTHPPRAHLEFPLAEPRIFSRRT